MLSKSTLDAKKKKLDPKSCVTIVEAKEQKEVVPSKFLAQEGCEVQLCFTYKPGNSYSLNVYGPFCGGRVSILSARIQVVSNIVKE